MPDNMKQEIYLNAKKLLPVFLIVDTSGSMGGPRIESVKQALDTVKIDLMNLNTEENVNSEVRVSLMQFDRHASWLQEMILPEELDPNLLVTERGITEMGTAFKLLESALHDAYMSRFVQDSAGYMHPVIIFLTDGEPTDNQHPGDEFSVQLENLKNNHWFVTAQRHVFACFEGADEKVTSLLTRFTGTPHSIYKVNSTQTLSKLLPMVTAKVSGTSSKLNAEEKDNKWEWSIQEINKMVEQIKDITRVNDAINGVDAGDGLGAAIDDFPSLDSLDDFDDMDQ